VIDWARHTPEEAADYIAKVAVAARREKRAAGPDLAHAWDVVRDYAGQAGSTLKDYGGQAAAWAGKQDPALLGAGIGAGLGGLGGAVLGARSERRKSPWATGLTGALAGGALGGGIGMALGARPAVGGIAGGPGAGETARLADQARIDRAHGGLISQIATLGDEEGAGDTLAGTLGRGVHRMATGQDTMSPPEGTNEGQNLLRDPRTFVVAGGAGAGVGLARDQSLLARERGLMLQHGTAAIEPPSGGNKLPQHVLDRIGMVQHESRLDPSAADRTLSDLVADRAAVASGASGRFRSRPWQPIPDVPGDTPDYLRRNLPPNHPQFDRAAVLPGGNRLAAQMEAEESALRGILGPAGRAAANKVLPPGEQIRTGWGRARTYGGSILGGLAAPYAIDFGRNALGYGQQPVNTDLGGR
jgi:hypothetical protein